MCLMKLWIVKIAGMLDKLYDLCSVEGSNNATIATKNGGLELSTSFYGSLYGRLDRHLVSIFQDLSFMFKNIKN